MSDNLKGVVKTKQQKEFMKTLKEDKMKAWHIAKLGTKLCRKCKKASIKRNLRNMTTKIEHFCPKCQSMFIGGTENVIS